jgi:hypothetical protein
MDERLENCIRCLEEYDLFVGKVAVILESEFAGEFRGYEERAFIDLTHYLEQALHVDHTITFLPFDRSVKKRLGYQRTWGPDKRSYSIRTARQFEPRDCECEMNVHEEPLLLSTGSIYNRLRSVPTGELLSKLSEEAREVVSVLDQAGGRALTKTNILSSVSFSEEDLSMAMLELIENDLLEEITEQQTATVVRTEEKDKGELSILGEVHKRDVGRVRKLLQAGANINELTDDGRNALFIAIENKDTDMAEILLQEGIDPNYESSDGTTALKLCWRTQNRTIEKLLSRYGAGISLE